MTCNKDPELFWPARAPNARWTDGPPSFFSEPVATLQSSSSEQSERLVGSLAAEVPDISVDDADEDEDDEREQ